MATADFNGDGIVDLLFGGGVYLGNGTGTFTLMVNPGGSGNPISVGDFNGDGWPDLITPIALESYPYTAMGVNIALEQSSSTVLTDAVTVQGPGSHNVIANYKGSGVNAASESSPVVLTGAQITTKLSLGVSPGTSIKSGTTVQVTAEISPSTVGSYAPSGTITFKDGSTVIGTGTVGSGRGCFQQQYFECRVAHHQRFLRRRHKLPGVEFEFVYAHGHCRYQDRADHHGDGSSSGECRLQQSVHGCGDGEFGPGSELRLLGGLHQ